MLAGSAAIVGRLKGKTAVLRMIEKSLRMEVSSERIKQPIFAPKLEGP
jgi:hypothetical protein